MKRKLKLKKKKIFCLSIKYTFHFLNLKVSSKRSKDLSIIKGNQEKIWKNRLLLFLTNQSRSDKYCKKQSINTQNFWQVQNKQRKNAWASVIVIGWFWSMNVDKEPALKDLLFFQTRNKKQRLLSLDKISIE